MNERRRFARFLVLSTILGGGYVSWAAPVRAQEMANEREPTSGTTVEILTSQSKPVSAAMVKRSQATSQLAGRSGMATSLMVELPEVPESGEVSTAAARFLNPDQNGVDPVDGSFNISLVEGAIGAGEAQMALVRHYGRAGWTSNLPERLDKVTSGSTYVTFKLTGVQVRFDWNGSTYVPQNGDGSTLTESADHRTFVYTDRDGIQLSFYHPDGAAFDDPIMKFCSPSVTTNCSALPMSERRPNNFITEFSWTVARLCYWSVGYCSNFDRVASIRNSAGYRIDFGYAYTFFNGEMDPSDEKKRNYFKATSSTFVGSGVSRTVTREFGSTAAQPTRITRADGQSYVFGYGAAIGDFTYPITSVQRPGEQQTGTSINYTASGVSSVTHHGVVTNYSRSATTTTSHTVVSGGYAATFDSDRTMDRVTEITDAIGNKTKFQFYPDGKLQRVTLPELNAVEYEYDPRGNLKKQTAKPKPNSGGTDLWTLATYPATCTNPAICNKPIWTRDARQSALYQQPGDNATLQTDYSYDQYGGLAMTTYPPDSNGVRAMTIVDYLDFPAPLFGSVRMPLAVRTCRTQATCGETGNERVDWVNYDSKLQTSIQGTKAGDGSNASQISYGRMGDGQVTSVTGPLSGINYSYDTAGRLVAATDWVTRIQQDHSYDSAGRLERVKISHFDESGNSTVWTQLAENTFSYDTYGRDTGNSFNIAAEIPITTYIGYDTLGRVSCATHSGVETCYHYDPLNRVDYTDIGFGTPDVRREASSFSANGKLASVTDGNGNRTDYVYDSHDRLNLTKYPSPSVGVGQSNPNDFEQLSYDASSNVVARRLRSGSSITYGYDNLGRLTSKVLPSTGIGPSTVNYAYDLHGNLTSASYPATGQTVSLSYDAVDRLRGEQTGVYSYALNYNAANLVTSLQHGDGLTIGYDYDGRGRLLTIRENGATSGPGVLATFSYNLFGQLSLMTRGNGTSTQFGLNFGRLKRLYHGMSGEALERTFAYNGRGQMTQMVSSNPAYDWPSPGTFTRGYSVNGLNQYTQAGGVSFGYDARGNLTSSGSDQYSYDAENRMETMNGRILGYDPLGRLQTVTGLPRLVSQADGSILAELNGSSIAKRYVFAPGVDQPILWYEGAGTSDRRWLHADERGSIIAVTNSAGQVIIRNRYDEYGIPASGNAGRFGYTGQAWVPEIGLYYYKARMYSPSLGRFMQTDPIGYGDGLNMHAYAGNDPVNHVDPTGLDDCPNGMPIHECNPDTDIWVGPSRPSVIFPSTPVLNVRLIPIGGGGGSTNFPDTQQDGCGNGGLGGVKDFLWGAGDVALLGFGDELRDALGIEPVDMNSTAYTAGEITGSVALLATGVGGGIRAAGAAARGLEFSHFIPARMGGARSIWNGNFVSIATHALSDPFRYRFMPRSWKAANPMPNRASQLWTRTPNTAKGTAAGAGAAGTGLANAGC